MTLLADRLDALLPQTQCGKCGFAGCRPYAEAMAAGDSPINRCPPGGATGIKKLAAALNTPELALDSNCGVESPAVLAVVDEKHCIGCTLCIQACPVDAILGAPKRMHSVMLAYCTGCELCIAPCPVDCIELIDVSALAAQRVEGAVRRSELTFEAAAEQARARFEARSGRLHRLGPIPVEPQEKSLRPEPSGVSHSNLEPQRKREAIMQALRRARKRRASLTP